jgi:hypothetical protein
MRAIVNITAAALLAIGPVQGCACPLRSMPRGCDAAPAILADPVAPALGAPDAATLEDPDSPKAPGGLVHHAQPQVAQADAPAPGARRSTFSLGAGDPVGRQVFHAFIAMLRGGRASLPANDRLASQPLDG